MYLRAVQDKYIALYRELVTQLCIYASTIRILAKGYILNTVITSVKLQEILNEVRKTLSVTNPNYDLVVDRLHLYYGMQLVTFGIDKDKNLIFQFLVFIQPYTQQPLILYQLETVPVPVLHQNDNAHSYTHLQVRKPYITLNSETYISLGQQELRTCERIGYRFCCEELFVVKHKTSYGCAIYFNSDTNIIKENYNFKFYYNKTDIIPTVLDGGNKIILANWPNDKHIMCTITNDIPVKIPSHPYVLVNRGVLCNCGIEADNHYLLESVAACDNKDPKLTTYFTVNTAFANYLDMFSNLTELLQFLLIKNRTTYEQILPINLNISEFDKTLLHASTNIEEFINTYTKKKEIFDLQERHETTILNTSKNFFSNNYIMDIFVFISSVISLISTTLVIYLVCKHKKIRSLITSLVLHQVKEVGTTSREANSECTTLAYIGIILRILSLIIVTFLHYRKSRFCKGYRFSNVVKVMIFISDLQNYVPIKLCKTAGSIHLFKIIGMLKAENIKLNKNYLWDTLEINLREVTVTFNGNKIDLPKVVVIKLQDKIKVRRLMTKEPLLFHLMLKQGIIWFTVATETQEPV